MADLEWEDDAPKQKSGAQWEEDNSPDSGEVKFEKEKPSMFGQNSLWNRAGADIDERIKNMQDYDTQRQQGKIGVFPAEIGKIGQAAALAYSDPITGIINAGAEDIGRNLSPDQKQKLQNFSGAVKNGINSFSSSSRELGLPQIPQSAIDSAQQYYNNSPNLKAVTEGAGNIVGAVPGAGTLEKFASPVTKESGLSLLKNMSLGDSLKNKQSYEDVGENVLKNEFPRGVGSEEAYEEAQKFYQQQADKGVIFDSNQTGKIENDLDSIIPKTELQKKGSWTKSGAADHVDEIKEALGSGPLSFADVLDRRSDINADIKEAFKSGNDKNAEKLLRVKDVLTNAMLSNDSPEWQIANHKFSIGATLEPFEDMAMKASTKIQPANSLDTYINNMLLDENKMRGLLPNEKDALRAVAENKTSDEIKKQLGSGFVKYASGALLSNLGMMGKLAGYGFGAGLSKMAKASAFEEKMKKLDMVYQAINSRTLNFTQKSAERVKPMLALPSPEMLGSAPMTDAQIAHSRAKLSAGMSRPRINEPYSGGPIRPQVNPIGIPTDPLQGAPVDPDLMSGMEELEPHLGAYDYPKKSGGGKIGFKLKRKKK